MTNQVQELQELQEKTACDPIFSDESLIPFL